MLLSRLLMLCATVLATAAGAETPLDAATFEARTTGRTFAFSTGADPFGHEWYRPGRRVIWAFSGDACIEGRWYPEERPTGTAICFAYDDLPEKQCWHVYDAPDGLAARFLDDVENSLLYEVRETESGIVCPNLAS